MSLKALEQRDSTATANNPVPDLGNVAPDRNRIRTICEDVLDGPPPTTLDDFRRPRLRKFPRQASDIRWGRTLGDGAHGIVYKAKFGAEGPFAVKLFWHPQKPSPSYRWAFPDECRSVALLEKLRWAMKSAESSGKRITIIETPKTRDEAKANIYAFADDPRDASPGFKEPPPFPDLPICYGWMEFDTKDLPLLVNEALPLMLYPPVEELPTKLYAIVYEWVEGKPQDLAIAQQHLDFFAVMGFAIDSYKRDNWRGGRLVDFGDVWSPQSYYWKYTRCSFRDAKLWMNDLDWTPVNGTAVTTISRYLFGYPPLSFPGPPQNSLRPPQGSMAPPQFRSS